jgi:hypothetical protein
MKYKLLYLLPLLIACMTACKKTPVVKTPPLAVPVGNFTGQYTRLHLTVATGVIDTSYAQILLSIDSMGNYAVTGDTSTLQAGSYGKCTLGYADDLLFTDKTLPAKGTPVKDHLSGTYQYTYGFGILTLQKAVSDSLLYEYNFTKN